MTTETRDRPPALEFTQRFSATPRGARLARRLTEHRLDAWGVPYGTALARDAALIVGELAANAVTHGRVPGRDFALRLAWQRQSIAGGCGRALLIEVSDTRQETAIPEEPQVPCWDAESGRGLLLVAAFAQTWGVRRRTVGKTVWATLAVPSPSPNPSRGPNPEAPTPSPTPSSTSTSTSTSTFTDG